jgi:hypothetical protein
MSLASISAGAVLPPNDGRAADAASGEVIGFKVGEVVFFDHALHQYGADHAAPAYKTYSHFDVPRLGPGAHCVSFTEHAFVTGSYWMIVIRLPRALLSKEAKRCPAPKLAYVFFTELPANFSSAMCPSTCPERH